MKKHRLIILVLSAVIMVVLLASTRPSLANPIPILLFFILSASLLYLSFDLLGSFGNSSKTNRIVPALIAGGLIVLLALQTFTTVGVVEVMLVVVVLGVLTFYFRRLL